MRRLRSSPRRTGAAALEFAMCLPIFVLIVAAIADLTQYIAVVQLVSRAARDGARIGSVRIEGSDATGDEIEADAVAHAELLLSAAGSPCGAGCEVTASWVAIDGSMFVRVTVAYPYEPMVGMTDFLADTATAEFVMMTQQQL